MGLVGLMDSVDKGEARHDYEVTMYGAADEITPLLVKGEVDVALVPCNLASVLYNKMKETGGVEVAAINTLGVLYIVTTGDDIASVADLAGKTIYSTGKGTTPEYTLNYILEQNGLVPGEDVTVEYKSEATEVVSAMQMSRGYPIAMLPQPYVTTAADADGGPFRCAGYDGGMEQGLARFRACHRCGAGAHTVCGGKRGCI